MPNPAGRSLGTDSRARACPGWRKRSWRACPPAFPVEIPAASSRRCEPCEESARIEDVHCRDYPTGAAEEHAADIRTGLEQWLIGRIGICAIGYASGGRSVARHTRVPKSHLSADKRRIRPGKAKQVGADVSERAGASYGCFRVLREAALEVVGQVRRHRFRGETIGIVDHDLMRQRRRDGRRIERITEVPSRKVVAACAQRNRRTGRGSRRRGGLERERSRLRKTIDVKGYRAGRLLPVTVAVTVTGRPTTDGFGCEATVIALGVRGAWTL